MGPAGSSLLHGLSPSGLCGPPPSPAQTLDPSGWVTGEALCPIRSLWSSAFPCSDPSLGQLGDWGRALCGPPPSPAQTLVLGGWGTGEALCPIRSLWSSTFPCWTGEGCALYPGLTLLSLKLCLASLVKDGLPCIPQPSRLPQRGILER